MDPLTNGFLYEWGDLSSVLFACLFSVIFFSYFYL